MGDRNRRGPGSTEGVDPNLPLNLAWLRRLARMLLALLLLAAAAPGDPPPNFVVVLLDDVGRDKIGLYGDHPSPAPTPHLDALAARGVLFRKAWAYPNCSPTRAALLTGRHSDRTGIGAVIVPGDGVSTPLPLSELLIPEALTGYASAAAGKWHLSDTTSSLAHPVLSGFDHAISYTSGNDYFSWTWLIDGRVAPAMGYFPTALAGNVVRVLQSFRSEPSVPYFLYYCPRFAHEPFHDPPPVLHTQGPSSSPFEQHVAMIESADTILGRVLHHVDLSNTYVFVIGDNGSPRQSVTAPFEPSKVKGSVYEGGVRVPFIVAGPGVAPGTECDELVHVTDVFATVMELAGLPRPASGAEDSISFAPLLQFPGSVGARTSLYVHRFPHPGLGGGRKRAMRTQRWKLIESPLTLQCELYDLEQDPLELNDLLQGTPTPAFAAIRDRLRAMMPVFP